MKDESVQKNLTNFKRNIEAANKLYNEIVKMFELREPNLKKLSSSISRFEEVLKYLSQYQSMLEPLNNSLSNFKKSLEESKHELHQRFAIDLNNEFEGLGLSLGGNYPKFSVWIFEIEVDFDKNIATLWYGKKQEKLDTSNISVTKVVDMVNRHRKQIGCDLSNPNEFCDKIVSAYKRVIYLDDDPKAPIIKILVEMSLLLQNKKFQNDPKKENFLSYSRADFSYDLHRFKKAIHDREIILHVATRSDTKDPQNFLWIPTNERGDGSTFSSLEVKTIKKE